MTWSRHPPIGGADADATHVVNTATGAPPNAQILDDLTAGIAHVTSAGLVTTFSGLAWNDTSRALTVANATADSAAHAYLDVSVQGTSGGDPHVRFTIPSGTSWYAGSDNSASDVFLIGTGTAVGTTAHLWITTDGKVGVSDLAPTEHFDVHRSYAGTLTFRIRNYEAGASCATQMQITTHGTGAGDCTLSFNIGGGGASWLMGLDNSVSSPEADPFVLARTGGALGTSDVLRCYSDRVQMVLGATSPGEGRWIRRTHVQTTNATVTTVATIAIGTSKLHHLDIAVTGMRSTSGEAAAYRRFAAYKNNAGTVTLIGAAATPLTAEDAAAWDVTLTISTTNVLVQVTGEAGKTVEWECVVVEDITAAA